MTLHTSHAVRSSGPLRTSSHQSSSAGFGQELAARYLAVRRATLELMSGISDEDAQAQSMPDASPAKWHLAHTTWFFETFVLSLVPGYRVVDSTYDFLFNSYYETVGPRVPRAQRGLLTRPSLADVLQYRCSIDERVVELLARPLPLEGLEERIELGLQHEQQHQELLLMDLKHLFGHQPLLPAYRKVDERVTLPGNASTEWATANSGTSTPTYSTHCEGLVEVGHAGPGFCFDNESPRHTQFVPGFRLGRRLVTNGEYLEFIADDGYDRPELWLSDGFRWRVENDVRLPLYWQGRLDNKRWREVNVFTLNGLSPIRLDEPVCHVSFYEADAYARWADARLPTEAQWEYAAQTEPVAGNFVESQRLHPTAARGRSQLFGDVWEWTQSAYAPYPGFKAASGALGEYNGKFMCNQMVLKGGSCVTPVSHARASYRNFFPPHSRWQFAGIRLARDT